MNHTSYEKFLRKLKQVLAQKTIALDSFNFKSCNHSVSIYM